jgi:DNA polymerase-3 subunit alpha
VHRAQYFSKGSDEATVIERAIRYGNTTQNNDAANQQSLFGGGTNVTLSEPVIPPCEPWNLMEKLRQEKEVTGMYLSGHPLDDYKIEFTNFNVTAISNMEDHKNKELNIAGIVTDVFEKIGKNNKPYATFTVEDYSGNTRITMWSEDYLRFKHFIAVNMMLYIKGSMRPRFNSTDQFEFKVSQIILLPEVREKLLNQVTLTIKADRLKNGFLQDFQRLLENHKGSVVLRLQIKDDEQRLGVSALATKIKVSMENDMVKRLEEMDIEYKLN